jgi:hypothetical protein
MDLFKAGGQGRMISITIKFAKAKDRQPKLTEKKINLGVMKDITMISKSFFYLHSKTSPL